jgi:hypothetical protein
MLPSKLAGILSPIHREAANEGEAPTYGAGQVKQGGAAIATGVV